MLKVSRLPSGDPEIFTSIQGEGITCGLPSVFVRLAHCNLACTWCDTKYTWDWSAYDLKTSVIGLSADDVAQRVLAATTPLPTLRRHETRHEAEGVRHEGPASLMPRASRLMPHASPRVRNVVVTGGEPLLQQGELARLAARLKPLRIEVETNGTVAPGASLASLIDQWNVSPKLANSGNAAEHREVAPTLRWFAARPEAYFKFVVVDPGDLDDVEELVDRYRIPPERVLLMPEGTQPSVLEERSRWLVERCVERGYTFSPRLHILLWGDERGR